MIFYHQKGLDFNFMTKTYGDRHVGRTKENMTIKLQKIQMNKDVIVQRQKACSQQTPDFK